MKIAPPEVFSKEKFMQYDYALSSEKVMVVELRQA